MTLKLLLKQMQRRSINWILLLTLTAAFTNHMKENNIPLYVHKKSNHPPAWELIEGLTKYQPPKRYLKQLQKYQRALDRSGYENQLPYEPPTVSPTKKKNRKRNMTWFNPPYSMNVKSNIGKEFLKLVDTAFPPGNPLRKKVIHQTNTQAHL
jgi:hypothetical protein